jgi:hypothetical protein
MNKIDGNLHATVGHAGIICMRLAATQVQFAVLLAATQLQDKRQADKRCVKGCIYIIIIFFKALASPHPRRMLPTFSADGPWIFGLENVLVLLMT